MESKLKTREEFAKEIGTSRTNLWRRLAELKLKFAGKLLSPKDQLKIKKALGFLEDDDDR